MYSSTPQGKQHPLHTVVETPEFRKRSARLQNEQERRKLIDYVAANPDAGDKMPGTGGARKLRWGAGAKGKSGGVRVITFYSGPPIPVFLLTIFGKGQRIDLTRSERNELRDTLKRLVAAYARRRNQDDQGR